jgi:predicted metal-binding membrane protein
MADISLAPSSTHTTAVGPWLRRGLPLLFPLALIGAAWLTIALMLRDEGASLPGLFADEQLREIFASLCRSDTGQPWWALLAGNFAMWGAMTLGMMLPCAMPAWRMLLQDGGWIGGYGFLAGYSAAWGGFAVAAAGTDAALHFVPEARLGLAPAALILAGLHQIGPVKAAAADALRAGRHCAGPERHSGLLYGWNCLRSDAVPMGLMMVFGSMNLLVMSALTALMLLEKTSPGRLLTQASGLGLLGFGAALWMIGAPG